MAHVVTDAPVRWESRLRRIGLVNESVPLRELRGRVRAIADILLEKNPLILKAAKDAFKRVVDITYDNAEDYLVTRQETGGPDIRSPHLVRRFARPLSSPV
jgi:enoyl-CoA hydratase/carnithine racemase